MATLRKIVKAFKHAGLSRVTFEEFSRIALPLLEWQQGKHRHE